MAEQDEVFAFHLGERLDTLAGCGLPLDSLAPQLASALGRDPTPTEWLLIILIREVQRSGGSAGVEPDDPRFPRFG